MGIPVGELVQRMTAAEESMWYALYSESPWGDERADLRSAQISQILFNQNVKKERQRPLTAFMPFYRKVVKAKDDVTESLRSWASKVKEK